MGNQNVGLHNRKVGLAQLFYKMVASKLNLLKSKEKVNEKVEYRKIDNFVEKVETGILKLVTSEYDQPSKAWNYDELAFSKFIEVKKDFTSNRYKYFDYTQDYLKINHDKIEEVTEDYLKAGMIDAKERLKEERNR